MKISAFYENIRTGADHDGISMAEAVSALREAGLEGVYVGYDSTRRYADELADVMQQTGVEITGLHAWINFDRFRGAAFKVIDQAARLGTDHVLIVPTTEGISDAPIYEGLQATVDYGDQKGVRVYLEDLDLDSSTLCTMGGVCMLLRRIPRLLCCFDTGNLIMFHEDETEGFKRGGSRVRALHLKDRAHSPLHPEDVGKRTMDGEYCYPAPVGMGYIKMAELLSMAGDMPAVVELYDYSPAHMLEGIRSSIEWVRRTENELKSRGQWGVKWESADWRREPPEKID